MSLRFLAVPDILISVVHEIKILNVTGVIKGRMREFAVVIDFSFRPPIGMTAERVLPYLKYT